MASSNHNGSNGNGHSWLRNTGRESFGLVIAEGASALVSVGVFALIDDIAPGMMKTASRAIGKTCVEPFLDTIESLMQKTCRLKECQPDFTKPRAERAEGYARFLIRAGIATVPAILTEYGARTVANHILKVNGRKETGLWEKLKHPTRHDLNVILTDKGVQLLGILAVNTIFAKQADNGIDAISNVLQKTLGWSKARATRAAEGSVILHVGDVLGLAAGAANIAHYHYTGKGKS